MSLLQSILALFGAGAAAKVAMDAAPPPKVERERFRPQTTMEDLQALLRAPQDPLANYNPFERRREAYPPFLANDAKMAMDQFEPGWGGALSQWGFNGISGLVGPDRTGFLGYPELSILARRPEYRSPAEIYAQAATMNWIELQSAGEKDKTKEIAAIEDRLKSLDAQAVFKTVSEHDSHFGRSHIYIDTGATDDQDELKTTLFDADGNIAPAKVGKGKLVSIHAIEPLWVWPPNYNSIDPLKKDFYRPETWYCMSVDGGLNPRLSGAALKTGTNFAAHSWRPECGAMDPCQRRKPPETVAKGQRLQGSVAR